MQSHRRVSLWSSVQSASVGNPSTIHSFLKTRFLKTTSPNWRTCLQKGMCGCPTPPIPLGIGVNLVDLCGSGRYLGTVISALGLIKIIVTGQ